MEGNKLRLNSLLDTLVKYTAMDYSHKMHISEKGDEIDAIAAGINMMAEEMKFRISKIQESEERFRLLVENVKDYAIFMLDSAGCIVSWNKGAEYIKGYSAQEVIGKHLSIFYTKEEIERGEPEYNIKIALEKGWHKSEGWRVKKNGSCFWADINLTALYDSEGKLKGFSKVTRDSTDRKKTELELKEKKEELVRSNEELEQFVYVASHDLQEPLRMITSYVQLLAKRYRDRLDKEANEFIDFAVDGSNRMRALINSLLEYSRINRQECFEKIDINDLVNKVLQNIQGQVVENNAVIKVDKLPCITGSVILIKQLFQNLIGNAIKFKGADNPRIFISGKKTGNECLFSIKDNGIGIGKEYGKKIFVIFQRLHSREKYPGTGIGLAICKKIAEKHGGKIWFESDAGKGSTFYFTIKENSMDIILCE